MLERRAIRLTVQEHLRADPRNQQEVTASIELNFTQRQLVGGIFRFLVRNGCCERLMAHDSLRGRSGLGIDVASNFSTSFGLGFIVSVGIHITGGGELALSYNM